MPTAQEIEAYNHAFNEKYHTSDNFYAVVDGLKLNLQHSEGFVAQNMFYNGLTHDHYVGIILLFAPSEEIIACAIIREACMTYKLLAGLVL